MKVSSRLKVAQKRDWGIRKTFQIKFNNRTAEIFCYAPYGRGMGSQISILKDQYFITDMWMTDTIEEFKQLIKQCNTQNDCYCNVREFLDFMRKKNVGVKVTYDF
jgi:hypothetical protein